MEGEKYVCVLVCQLLYFPCVLLVKSVCAEVFFPPLIQVRVQAIRGLPLFCKDTPENIGKMVDILVQILGSGKLQFLKVLHS